ncbi:MAG: hypothetical protein DRR08_25230 [Candidatus Parabeggiatoa sp. nov. 2]|nr:MAG: hypothetical protein B6247_03405 [Beggiatoa sp. 4572_84]RKZ55110.1 MAG: hypothetical protein DRR08_25230 [Gammaproteobacteria bacterium]
MAPCRASSFISCTKVIGDKLAILYGLNWHLGELFFLDSLNLNKSATFFGPNRVQNVINRVTGGNPSHI